MAVETQQKIQKDVIEATVGGVRFSKHKHSKPYFFAYPRDHKILPRGTPITCSLSNWEDGRRLPEKGQVVFLFGIEEFAKGWRARKACPKKPGRKE